MHSVIKQGECCNKTNTGTSHVPLLYITCAMTVHDMTYAVHVRTQIDAINSSVQNQMASSTVRRRRCANKSNTTLYDLQKRK